ncbi:hypothetical protein SXIM_32580 [Streptomyces xiamenensis]|uniref:Uncharacterized protein n=1 Tax=Streptomyces xiamenensis TaxID=408015 RepID=A0A0F7FWE6_9ACTN|nr:hypothetical protein SXIM_32580 [Streptomyces xiamenensis]
MLRNGQPSSSSAARPQSLALPVLHQLDRADLQGPAEGKGG